MANFQKRLTLLELHTTEWLKAFKKDKNLQKNEQLVKQYKQLLALKKTLTAQVQEENSTKTEIAEDIINSGMQTNATKELVIGDGYKEIKELQTFLTEDNIRDTNPIIILSFGKLLELSIDYLQNLKGMLLVLGKHCHDEDLISQDVQEAILSLFKGGKKNEYCFSVYISSMLEKSMSDTFNVIGTGRAPLGSFCVNLAQETQLLINELQNTKQGKLRKKLGRKFRKHKKAPYPFVGKILTTIDLYDIPHDVAGDQNKEEQLKLFANWHSAITRELGQLENTNKTELTKQVDLTKSINDHGASLDKKFTPDIVKEALFSNVVANLNGKEIVSIAEVVQTAKNELELLKPKLKELIKTGGLNTAGNTIETFVGIPPTEYIQTLQAGMLPNQFDTYKKVIKDWVIAVDRLINQLGIDKEKGKYNYKAKDMVGNLARLFKTNHPLIALQDFFNPIQKGLIAEGFSTELTTVDDLFSDSINSGRIYQSLINNYNKTMQDGTFQTNLDTLDTVLPSIDQIKAAILDTKIDIVLNREVQYLNLGWTITWNDRISVLNDMVDMVINTINIPAMIEALAQRAREAGDEPINWRDLIMRNITNPVMGVGELLVTIITNLGGDSMADFLNNVAAATRTVIDGFRNELRGIIGAMDEGGIEPTILNLNIPIKLGLGEQSNGKIFAYAHIDDKASIGSIFTTQNQSPYQFDCTGISTVLPNTAGVKNTTITTNNKFSFLFKNEGSNVDVSISAVFVSISGSTLLNRKELSFVEDMQGTSTFDGKNVNFSLVVPENLPNEINNREERGLLIDRESEIARIEGAENNNLTANFNAFLK